MELALYLTLAAVVIFIALRLVLRHYFPPETK